MRNIIILLTLILLTSSCSLSTQENKSIKNLDSRIKSLMDHGKYKQAVELMSSVASNSQNDIKSLINISWMYAFDQKFDKSLKITDEIIRKNASYQEVYYLRGYVYQKLDNFSAAVKNYQRAIDLDPKDIKSISSIAEVYKMQEDYNKAIKNYIVASKMEPENYIYHLDLADMYFKKNDFKTSLNEAQLAYSFAPIADKEEVKEILENIKLNAVLNH